MHVKDNGERRDRVDVMPETSTTKSTIKNEKNRTLSSATMKIVPTLVSHGSSISGVQSRICANHADSEDNKMLILNS